LDTHCTALHLPSLSSERVINYIARQLVMFCFYIILSQVSSVIYLDSPAGVGLSYSNNVSDYETGDFKTAADSHTFLLKVI
jgi:hypothetical protein